MSLYNQKLVHKVHVYILVYPDAPNDAESCIQNVSGTSKGLLRSNGENRAWSAVNLLFFSGKDLCNGSGNREFGWS